MREKEENEGKEFNKQKQNTEKSIELECIPHRILCNRSLLLKK